MIPEIKAYLLTYPHGALANRHHRNVLRSIQPNDADFSGRNPGDASEVMLSGVERKTEPEIVL